MQAVDSTTPPSPTPYLPAGQGVHSDDPAIAKYPLVHVSQMYEARSVAVPFGHTPHTGAAVSSQKNM